MKLRIYDESGSIDTDFGWWLIPKISSAIISSINMRKLDRWNTYINETSDISRLYTRKYKVEDIIIFACNNLVCKGTPGEIYIEINPVINAPGFDRIKLSSICKMINFGVQGVKEYPLFTSVFKEFKSNITDYVRMYYLV